MRPARWGSGFLRSGLHPGASPTVCFAAPPLDAFGCAKRSLRSHPRMNPSTQPSDVARGSRSKAAAELTLILLSGAALPLRCTQIKNCGSEPAREGGPPANQSPTDSTQSHCGSELAREDGLTSNQSPTDYPQSNCGSELARESGPPANQSLADCTRSNCRSEPARDDDLPANQSPTNYPQSNCGSQPAREGGLSVNRSPTDCSHTFFSGATSYSSR